MGSIDRKIAKNTLFLYIRMMLTMLISLYTSRVILNVLGVEDFGIYQSVGGIVLLLSFVNGALSAGSSRFLTFELGTGNKDKLQRTFTTVFSIHVLLAVLVIVIAEPIGIWLVNNKLVIPEGRLEAATFAFHISLFTSFFTIIQVPFTASIISHENMSVYAYMSIAEVSLRLGIVFLLSVGNLDKLEFYAILLCIVQISIAFFYILYCIKRFPEVKCRLSIDRSILKSVLSYSGWNLFASTSIALNTQGTTILINMFFNPSVVTARAIANQVNMAANQFVQNFRTAVNPQIVKQYAAGDINRSKRLLLDSTKYSFYLMLMLSLPICLVAETLLRLWLGVIPEYATIFLQLAIVTSLFQVFDTSFYTALYAIGRIRENALISPVIGFLVLPVSYIFFKTGSSPVVIGVVMLVFYAILGLVVKPWLIIKYAGYTVNDIVSVFIPCFKVLIVSVAFPIGLSFWLETESLLNSVMIVLISIVSVSLTVWFLGITCHDRRMILNVIKSKLRFCNIHNFE